MWVGISYRIQWTKSLEVSIKVMANEVVPVGKSPHCKAGRTEGLKRRENDLENCLIMFLFYFYALLLSRGQAKRVGKEAPLLQKKKMTVVKEIFLLFFFSQT